MSKRSIAAYFLPTSSKKPRISTSSELIPSTHTSYPFPIRCLPTELELASRKRRNDEGEDKDDIEPVHMDGNDDLDMLYYHPFLNNAVAKELFLFLRNELPFYRVEYKINRNGVETLVKTPRFTTIFGVDESSYFHPSSGELLDTGSKLPIPKDRYRTCTPRPIPQCVDILRQYVEKRTNCKYNFVLINYYVDGGDSISYHSDDERFLGENPAIASLSLGSRRDFLMKHKTIADRSVKLALSSGDMVLMRGTTQGRWLHSIPKRSTTVIVGDSAAIWAGSGRVNITFRKAILREETTLAYGSVWEVVIMLEMALFIDGKKIQKRWPSFEEQMDCHGLSLGVHPESERDR